MISAALVLNALRQEPVYHADRARPDRDAILQLEANAIAKNARTLLEAAELMALSRYESGHAAYVILGHCSDGPRGARCDNGKSRTPWQLRKWCKPVWALAEDDPAALDAGAKCAIRMLRFQADRGRDHAISPLVAAFAGYAARPWSWHGAVERAETTRRILRRMGGAE